MLGGENEQHCGGHEAQVRCIAILKADVRNIVAQRAAQLLEMQGVVKDIWRSVNGKVSWVVFIPILIIFLGINGAIITKTWNILFDIKAEVAAVATTQAQQLGREQVRTHTFKAKR